MEDPDSIEMEVERLIDEYLWGAIRRSADQVCQDVQTYADVGVTYLIFDFRTADPRQTEERMSRFAEEVMAVT